ncbi:MAG: hypothetical protein II098_08695 [Treponema sp.]|nr:hypothetical protein [Treponema sp.]
MTILNLMCRIRFFIIVLVMVFSGCSNRENVPSSEEGLVSLYDIDAADAGLEDPTQTWHVTDERVCIVYGYGYNDDEFVKSMNSELFSLYGSCFDGGLIYPLVFPGDFKRGTKHYISVLYDYIVSKKLKGLVILGAPEGTCTAIGRLQDFYNGHIPYPIFSFFSQDDVLGMEYSSDFVLDKAQKAEINGIVANEKSQDFVEDVPDMLKASVKCILNSDAPFEKNARLFEVVKKIAGTEKTGRYSDPETGLFSINHFVME